MLEWLAENIGTILITAGLIVIVVLIIRSIVRDKKAGISSCGAKCGGCGACAMAGKCHGSSGCGGSALRDVKNLKHQNT